MSKKIIGVEFEQSELKRKIYLLNILIWSLVAALGVFLIIVLLLRLPSMSSSLISIISGLLLCIIAYLLARYNRYYLAAGLFLCGFIVIANISVLLPNIPLETRIVGPLFYSLSVVAAGVLIAPLVSFWFAGFGAATLLTIVSFLGGSDAFNLSGQPGTGWAMISVPIIFSFILASMSWLFGDSLNKAFYTLKQRSEELQASHQKLEVANEELRATEEELRVTNEDLQSANNELRGAQEQLVRSEKLAAIGQLASGVGHELRNPLGAIKNAVFYIRRRISRTDLPSTEPRLLEFLDIIDEEVGASNKVITDLLGFSRVARPTVSPTSTTDIIESALRYTPVPENIDLVMNTSENLLMVMVDTDQIRQVFANIILNAIQAMPDGGRLGIQASSNGEYIDVEFADTGSGIPESVIGRVFDPLFTTKAKGIGLGLSVSKSTLERHGGDIRVKSIIGKGTTFTVSLPTQ